MDESYYIIQDDVSRFGLKRLHVMRPKPISEEDIDDLDSELESIQADNRREFVLQWIDEIGNHHAFLAKRLMMGTKMFVAQGKFEQALKEAARGYLSRTSKLPNRVVVHAGAETPDKVILNETAALVEKRIWMQAGYVGVYRADGDQNEVDGDRPHGKDRRVAV